MAMTGQSDPRSPGEGGHYTASGARALRLVDGPVVDTETHVFLRAWPIATSPQMSPIDPYTRAEHSGDLLMAEMDRIGVDMSILIGYDGYDFVHFMHRFGSDPGDFMGGRGYTKHWAAQHPSRFRYVTTLRHPASWPALSLLEKELSDGACGVKIFPAYLRMLPDAPEIRAVFDMLVERGAAAVFGHEDCSSPETPSLVECYKRIDALAADFPDVPIQLNHGGNALPGSEEMRVLSQVVNAHPNILISTSVLGGVLMDWADGWRYPYPTYLSHLGSLAELINPLQLAWGTDWPWFEGWVKYPLMLQAIVDHATFFSAEQRAGFVGGNAVRHWRLTLPASP
jgi:predicted TIM-barrel fold metal-dependent hydrolase